MLKITHSKQCFIFSNDRHYTLQVCAACFGWGVMGSSSEDIAAWCIGTIAHSHLTSVSSGCYTSKPTFTPVLVLHVRPSLFASTAAVTVVPLLPPQPTSITPSLGTRLSVRNVISVVQGVTCVTYG